jgi:hypothetical protein
MSLEESPELWISSKSAEEVICDRGQRVIAT